MPNHEQRLAELADAYRKAQTDLDDARDALTHEMKAAKGDGMRQADIIRATGHLWTREYLRKILKS